MRTLGHPRDLADIIRRLRTVRPENPARWGPMTAPQMICHLGDALRMATGEKAVSAATGPLQRTVVKWMVLYLPVPWPAGISTRPELDQECAGTRPADFASDLAHLESLLKLVTTQQTTLCPAHPLFGRMSPKAWLRWAYLHTDHHLRQFGA